MNQPVKQFMAPFQAHPIVFDTPKKPGFVINRFTGLIGAIKLLWQAHKQPNLARAEAAYNEAMKAHSIGRFNHAEDLYNECIQLQPDHEPAYTNLASLYLERNSDDLAIEALKQGLRIRPFFYRGYYNLGTVYHNIGHLEEAIAMLEQALRYNDKHIQSYVVLAEIYASRQDIEDAIAYYQKMLPLTSSPELVHMRMAELYLKIHDLTLCEQCLRQALAVNPRSELHYNLGWLLAMKKEEPEQIVDCFLMAHKGRGQFKEALFNLALAQSAASDHEKAVTNMVQYVKSYGKKDSNDMLKHLNYLRQVNSDNHLAAMQVAQLYLDSGQVQKAVELLTDLVKTAKRYSPAVKMLAETYHHMGRHKDAIRAYLLLVEIAPRNATGFLGLARCYGDIENFDAAMPVLVKVLELEPQNIQIHYQYATLQAQAGNLAEALKHYRFVASADASFPRIQKRLRMLEEELEERKQLAQHPWPTNRTVSPATSGSTKVDRARRNK